MLCANAGFLRFQNVRSQFLVAKATLELSMVSQSVSLSHYMIMHDFISESHIIMKSYQPSIFQQI